MFDYLLKKIKNAEFKDFPYRHIYIEDFFNNSDFNKIVKGTQINLPAADSIEELIKILKDNGLIFQSQVSYLIPIFGTILGYIFLKELITIKVLISLTAVCIGIYFVRRADRKKLS